MGYLLTKQADMVPDKTSLGIPYMKPTDSETVGNILGGGIAGGGLIGSAAIGNSLLEKKLRTDSSFRNAVTADSHKIGEKLIKMTGGDEGWLAKRLWKDVPGKLDIAPTALNKTIGKGIGFSAGFKNLKLLGKLKALGLLAAPLAAGGLIDAAVD